MLIKNIKNQIEIDSLETWRKQFFSGKKAKHWVQGRSAFECANYWLKTDNLSSLSQLLSPQIVIDSFDEAYPECELKFDENKHPRENDLLLIANKGDTLISVEAKTDESFSKVDFLNAMKSAIAYKNKKPESKQPERLFNLYKNYFNSNNEIFTMMHQLLYWFAGSIAEAKRRDATNIVLLNQVFYNPSIHDTKAMQKNHKDFEYFSNVITNHKISEIVPNTLYGPINNEYTQGKNIYLLNQIINI